MRALLGFVVLLAACAGDPLPLTACTAGVQTACVCPGGATGAQRCAADGSAFGACECPDGSAPADVQQLADVLERDAQLTDLVTVDAQLADERDASSPADAVDVVDTGPTCGPGYSVCAGVCVGLTGDVNNCGSCGHVCTTSLPHALPLCRTTCGFTCQPGWRNCNTVDSDGCEHEGASCP